MRHPLDVNTAAEAPFELKFGHTGIVNLRLRDCDPEALHAGVRERLEQAPTLFQRAPVILDLGDLAQLPDAGATRALVEAVRSAGMLPVGLAYGRAENEELAQALGLPLFAKFRAAPENGAERATPARAAAGLHHARPVRSGQQIYAQGRDLVLHASVGNGAEVIADGSIHVYGCLRGRALAGAQGDAAARIYCTDFRAELVSIAGCYRVLEDFPADLRGAAVQAWLDGDKLLLEKL